MPKGLIVETNELLKSLDTALGPLYLFNHLQRSLEVPSSEQQTQYSEEAYSILYLFPVLSILSCHILLPHLNAATVVYLFKYDLSHCDAPKNVRPNTTSLFCKRSR